MCNRELIVLLSIQDVSEMLGDISSYGTSLFMYSCHADIEVREETVVSLLSDESDNEGNQKNQSHRVSKESVRP